MNGKGDKRRPCSIPKAELEIREELLYGPEADKPALLDKLNRLVEDRLKHDLTMGLYKGAYDK